MLNFKFNKGTHAAALAMPIGMQHMTFMADHSDNHVINDDQDNKIYRNGKPGWFWPLLLLLLVIGWLWYYLRCCSNLYEGGRGVTTAQHDDQHGATHDGASHDGTGHDGENHDSENMEANAEGANAAGTLDANGNFVINTGANTEISLPDGTKMQVGANSTENRLYKMLTATTPLPASNSKDAWITLDRVYFESGGSKLTAESAQQLKNIAAILRNYPTAQVKMGGYTDNTGSLETNVKISGARAAVAAKSLTDMGIAAGNVSSEGFGPEHPVCEANDTPECKAQNRRVDIRIKSR